MINCRLCFVHFRSTVRPSQRRDVKDVKEDGHMEKTNAARRLSFASAPPQANSTSSTKAAPRFSSGLFNSWRNRLFFSKKKPTKLIMKNLI